MKVLVAIAVLTWSNLLSVEGNLMEVQETPRGFFPGPFFPPFQPTYPPGVYPPFSAPPECFPQPVVPEVVTPQPTACPVCPEAAESCLCEPVFHTCQTYTITVCPSAPPVAPADEPAPVVEEIVIEKNGEVETVAVITEKQEVPDVTPEFVSNPAIFGPIGGFAQYPGGFGQLIGGMYPQFGGFPSPYGGHPEGVSGLRSLGDDETNKNNSKE